MSSSSLEEVRTTTGISRVRGSARSRWSTSMPLSLGSLRSSRTTAGKACGSRPACLPVENRKSRASCPSLATNTSLAMFALRSARRVRSSSSWLSSTSRIVFSIVPSCMLSTLFFEDLGVAHQRVCAAPQGEVENGAVAHLALGPDAPAVTVDDALHRREPDPGSRVVAHRVQSLKSPEELVDIPHVEPGAVVAHEEGH